MIRIISGNSTLGHVRLSIMDPENGKQPIYNEDGTKAVIANGEIYNYLSLKNKLRKKHKIISGNDSEVLVHLSCS
jgi:asparagine synthase (glutamine-hydrolysing)